MIPDDLFSLEECRTDDERALTHALNRFARRWLALGGTLLGPWVQEYGAHKLLYFVESCDPSQVVRIEYHEGRAVVGLDLTGQGGPDLDASQRDVLVVGLPGDLIGTIADVVAKRVEKLLSSVARRAPQNAIRF